MTTGVLLINVGTPDAAEEIAVRNFLAEFLSDPLVVDYPRWLWKPILEKIILKKRPGRSAKLYQQIWTAHGSPLLSYTESLAARIQDQMGDWRVAVGMRYGNPSIQNALETLSRNSPSRFVVLPLYPQWSSTTTLTAIQAAEVELLAFPELPAPVTINSYHDQPAYISALAESLHAAEANLGKPERVLFSYHGIPRRLVVKKGEPYRDQCLATTRLVAERAGINIGLIMDSFQSRFGPEAWLEPDTNMVLEELGREGNKQLHVICPGFAADCLETLEEIAKEGKKTFQEAGGGEFHYIPALNDTEGHARALIAIIQAALAQ